MILNRIFTLLLCLLLTLSSASTLAKENKKEALAKVKTTLAVEYLYSKEYRNAIDAIETAVNADANYMPAWLVRGYVYQELKQFAKAEESYRRALAIQPNSAEANNNYGWFLCNNHQESQSIAYFDKALSDPAYPEPQIAYMNKGLCLSKLGKYEEANSSLISALRENPNFFAAMKGLVENSVRAGNAALAQNYFQQYQKQVRNLSAEDLYLGIQVARLNHDYDTVSHFGTLLKENYPYSIELQKFLSGQ